MGETSTNNVATQSLQASFGDTSSNAVCTDLIQVLSLKAKSNDHYQIKPACRAVGQSSLALAVADAERIDSLA